MQWKLHMRKSRTEKQCISGTDYVDMRTYMLRKSEKGKRHCQVVNGPGNVAFFRQGYMRIG